jgi:hypothetical protein
MRKRTSIGASPLYPSSWVRSQVRPGWLGRSPRRQGLPAPPGRDAVASSKRKKRTRAPGSSRWPGGWVAGWLGRGPRRPGPLAPPGREAVATCFVASDSSKRKKRTRAPRPARFSGRPRSTMLTLPGKPKQPTHPIGPAKPKPGPVATCLSGPRAVRCSPTRSRARLAMTPDRLRPRRFPPCSA